MRILIASDKFKGSLTAPEACAAIQEGLRNHLADEEHEIRQLPIADGGDGMARSLTEAKGGKWRTVGVKNALGEPVEAGYGLVGEGTVAIIEMAEASGLAHLSSRRKNPWIASTHGTGELIRDAIAQGVEKVILGIGGSATNDGGTGMAQALGYRFVDRQGKEIDDIPGRLPEVAAILRPDGLALPEVVVACDVENELLGPEGCTRVYGPQKGITEAEMARHEDRLSHLVRILGELGENASHLTGSGAAGGLGFGSLVFLRGKLVPGFELVSQFLNLAPAVEWADLVLTGEGKLDSQSLQGKAPAGVAKLARAAGKQIVAFCGIKEEGVVEDAFDQVIAIRNPDWSLEENMNRASSQLSRTAGKFAEQIA